MPVATVPTAVMPSVAVSNSMPYTVPSEPLPVTPSDPADPPEPEAAAGPAEVPEPTDAELLDMTRQGNDDAYAELWWRYSRRAHKVARRVTSTFEPDDLVAEAFTRILNAVRSGGGPTGSFAGYLYSTIRNVAAKWARNRLPMAGIDDIDDIASDTDFAESIGLADSVTRALQSLPERWQRVLWYSEVEGLTPAELSAVFGIKPAAAAMLASRARQGLRQAWSAVSAGQVPRQR